MSIAIMSRLFRIQFGSANRKMLAIRLADFADDDGRGIWPTVARLARETEISDRTVQRILKDMVDEGILIVVREGGGRPGQATRYDFNMQALSRLELAENGAGNAPQKTENPMGDTVSPVTNDTETGDKSDIEGCHGVTQTVIEPLNKPSIERGGAIRNEIGENTSHALSPEENPKSAAFEKRVIRFCSGVGYQAGKWPNWDTGKTATLSWIRDRFAELSPEERADAERWRCAYLMDIASRREKPKAVGVFIQDKLWNALDPAILERLEAAKAAENALKASKPDGWSACFGPVGMARLFGHFYEGAADPELAEKPFLPNALFAKAWPKVMQFRMVQQQNGGALFGQQWQECGRLFEPVPQGTDTLADWKREFKRRNWPWLAEFDRLPVVYCPKGGVAGLADFEARLAEVKQDAGQ